MRENAGLVLIGVFCLYPLILWAVPAFLIGRYRMKLRSPILLDRGLEATPAESKSLLRKIEEKRDRVGYGANR